MAAGDCETLALAGPVEHRGTRVLLAVLCLGLGLSLSGCAVPDGEEANAAALALLSARKDRVKPGWRNRRIGKETVREYAQNRANPLVEGEVSLTLSGIQKNVEEGKITVQVEAEGKGVSGWGTACAITEDGYFLTAAHCVEKSPVYIICGNENGAEVVRARVVWVSPAKVPIYDPDEPDLALIHVQLRPEWKFPLARPDEISPGTRVVIAGYGGLNQNQAYGRVLDRSPWKTSKTSGARWIEVIHSAPLIQGDSGGPAADTHGRLLGINSAGSFRVFRFLGQKHLRGYRCLTVCPDPEWIRELIEKDRAERR